MALTPSIVIALVTLAAAVATLLAVIFLLLTNRASSAPPDKAGTGVSLEVSVSAVTLIVTATTAKGEAKSETVTWDANSKLDAGSTT